MSENKITPPHQHEEHAHHHDSVEYGHQNKPYKTKAGEEIITIRSHSGLSGDMLLCGLSLLALRKNNLSPESAQATQWLDTLLSRISPQLNNAVIIGTRKIEGIGGWTAIVDLPEIFEHRTLADINKIIMDSSMSDNAKKLSSECFTLLAECEAFAHGMPIEKIHFHEVGALDSILDICGVCALYDFLEMPAIICSPLPMCDGEIHCMHGILPAPAPAVLQLLKGLAVKPFAGETDAGELLTPTAAALLQTLKVCFGSWPQMTIANAELVYGSKTFRNVPNGATFVMGTALE